MNPTMSDIAEFANTYHYHLDDVLEMMINNPMMEDMAEWFYNKGLADGESGE